MLHKKIITAGSLTFLAAGCLNGLLISSTYAAGPPIPFNDFSVSSGAVSAGCPPIADSCVDNVSDNGFLQRIVTITNPLAGVNQGTYIQFILTDPGVTGNATGTPFSAARGNLNFSNEDFVKMGNNSSGIASHQTLLESTFTSPTLEDRFVYDYSYLWGWALSTFDAAPWIDFHQDISQVDYSAGPLSPKELMYSTLDVRSNGNGFTSSINRTIEQMVAGTGPGEATKFVYATRNPARNCHPNTDCNPVVGGVIFPFFPLSGDSPLLPGGTNGGDITWGTNDEVNALWVGQVTESSSDLVFGYTRYTVLNPSTLLPTSTSLVSFNDPDPLNWDNPFGTSPTVTSVRSIIPTAVVAAPDPLTATVPAGAPAVGPTTPVTLPLAYDSWTVTGGVVTPDPCVGIVCSEPSVNEGGLFQRVITIGGEQYIQTIVTDSNATGDPSLPDFDPNGLAFKQETLVKNNSDGVAANFKVTDDLNQKFVNSAVLKTGWAHGGPLDPIIEVNQSVATPFTNPALQSSAMWDTFYLAQGETQADKIIDINAAVGSNTPTPGQFYTLKSPVMFRTNIIEGVFQTDTHTLADAPLLPSTGGNIAWNPGDAIQATWMGARYTTTDPFAESIVSSTSYTNLSTGDRVAYTDRTDPNPDSWVIPPFLAPAPTWVTTLSPP